MSVILSRLRKDTNGAVTGAMEDRGVVWPLNYGVSVHAVRAAVSDYAPDHSLGKLLYRQQVRELRLAGTMVADPLSVTIDELLFWADGVVNTEVAEHLSFMFARSPVLPAMVDSWLTSGNELLCYSAMLSATRRIKSDKSVGILDAEHIFKLLPELLLMDSYPLWRSLAAFLNVLYAVSPVHRSRIEEFAISLSGLSTSAAEYISAELYLEPDDTEM